MSNPFNFWDMPDEVYGAMEDDYIFGMSSEPSTKTLYDRLDESKRRKLGLADPEEDFDYNDLDENEDDPSKYIFDYWIYAYSKYKYKQMTDRCGKWLVFVPEKFINAAWEQIKDATEKGLLGGSSKCSTLKGRKNGPGSDYVCCVFTYDWRDEKDVMRVREALRELGFTKPLPYKTDADTIAGKYACKGAKKISKYWE